jgi:hypothetical protein
MEPRAFFALEEGTVWVNVSVKAIDDGDMHLFQSVEYDMGQSWQNLFRIEKKEFVEILDLLKRIVELLEKKGARK